YRFDHLHHKPGYTRAREVLRVAETALRRQSELHMELQLDLFELTPSSSSPLIGQHVRLDRICSCGSNIAIAGPAYRMHAARLSCASCGAVAGWLPRAEAVRREIARLMRKGFRT